MQKVVVGIDIGAESTKVVLGASQSGEIVRNPVGGHTTPTLVSFDDGRGQRKIGATGNSKSKNAVQQLNRLLSDELPEKDSIATFSPYSSVSKEDSVIVENLQYNGETRSFTNSALIAMLVGQLQKDVQATLKRRNAGAGESSDTTTKVQYVFSCGPDVSPSAQQELLNAAYAATGAASGDGSIPEPATSLLVDRTKAYCQTYQRKFPEHAEKTILIVDMGHAETTVAVVGPSGKSSTVTEETKGEDTSETTPSSTVLAAVRKKGLGAGLVDVRLWEHFQSTIPALKDLSKKSRGGQRLLVGVAKLKHLLSQLPEASVTVENVGANDSDLNLEGRRSQLVELCQTDVQDLTGLLQQALKAAEIEPSTLFAVEVVGGGCRIPWVKETIEQVTQISTLSYSLDDTSAAYGAALMGESDVPDILSSGPGEEGPTELQTSLRKEEASMAALDADYQARETILNQMESHILELRSAKHSTHGSSLLPGDLFTHLDEVENWLFSEEVDDANKDQLQEKWNDLQKKTDEWTKDYREALDKERQAKDAEMEIAAKEAQKERDGEEGQEEDDHDNRRLPKKRRMEIVMKNKKEGGELFSDGNYKFAAARYAKALSHCAKFVDLGPEDLEEVNAMKLTLNMNLALAYLKMKNPDQALRYCNDALALDGDHVKALYRRASVYYEKKNWTAASQDLKKAVSKLDGATDKAVQKLQEKVDAQLKRQKQKEKKMAQKMFG